MQHGQKQISFTAGASITAGFEVGDGVLMAIQMPATWTAAAITFQASQDGVTYADLYQDKGDGTKTEINLAAAASVFIAALDPTVFGPISFLKVRSGTSGSPVTQTLATTLTLIFM